MNRHIKLVQGLDYYFHLSNQMFRLNEPTLTADWVIDVLLTRTDSEGSHLFVEII